MKSKKLLLSDTSCSFCFVLPLRCCHARLPPTSTLKAAPVPHFYFWVQNMLIAFIFKFQWFTLHRLVFHPAMVQKPNRKGGPQRGTGCTWRCMAQQSVGVESERPPTNYRRMPTTHCETPAAKLMENKQKPCIQ